MHCVTIKKPSFHALDASGCGDRHLPIARYNSLSTVRVKQLRQNNTNTLRRNKFLIIFFYSQTYRIK